MEPIAQPFRTPLCMLCLFITGISIGVRLEGTEPLVLLTNGNVLRGTPQVQGHLVILTREDGTQLRIRQDQVAFSAASMRQLYEHRVGQHSFRSAAIHADDVSWCLRNDLIDEAETELNKLKSMDPSYPWIPRLHRQIESAKSPRSAAPIQSLNIGPEEPNSTAEKFDAPSGITPAAVAAFATRVQPMLINRCSNAGCHRTGGETKWQLSHLGVSVRVSSKMTQRNLEATAPYLDFDDPSSSELLRYLLTPHAEGRYDTTGRSAQSAEATLREWLSQLGRYPQPIAPGAMQVGSADLPLPVSPSGYAQWPGNDAGVAPASNVESIGSEMNPAEVPEGFAIDDEGQLIYDPDREFHKTEKPPVQPNVNDLVPPGYPSPVIGPGSQGASNTSSVPSIPTVVPLGAPNSIRPKRLPAISDPFSADLFNRQSKLTATKP